MVFDDNNGIVSYNRVISWNKRGKISDRIVMDQVSFFLIDNRFTFCRIKLIAVVVDF